ncbi:MAG: ferric reductase-like transmembrane domain-containing protein [Planctomycetes bacterium]|nr:ferric reductase-like transmembrane domain-containing protein [Planctomycetota bacterium]
MSVSYTWVGWNRQKRLYDATLAAGIVSYLAAFLAIGKFALASPPTDEALIIRALGSCALVMLHAVLWIGPLARINPRFLPLLFNRRHLGVATFLVGLAHALLTIGYYHGFGGINPLLSLLTSNTNFTSLRAFPFEILGVLALAILFLMAATSHDFWNRTLGPRAWKTLHMSVYLAYALLIMHVALGAMQSERTGWVAALLITGALTTTALHLRTGSRELSRDARQPAPDADNFIDACAVDEVPESRAKVVCLRGKERIAVFKHQGRFSAVGNVCAHQGGPLGEGKIIDGCITCPWHGWQYRPHDGCSPPPFSEKIPTYELRIRGGRIQVNPTPNPPGTPVTPA